MSKYVEFGYWLDGYAEGEDLDLSEQPSVYVAHVPADNYTAFVPADGGFTTTV